MLSRIVRKIGKGIDRFMDKRIQVCKEVLSTSDNRRVAGVIILFGGIGIGVGLGGGLIASSYIK